VLVTAQDYHPWLASIPRGAPVEPLAAWIDRVAGERPAAILSDEIKSYADLRRDRDRVAEWLADQGVGAGDVVGVQLPNGWDFLVVHAALASLGAVMATLHRPYSAAECHQLLETVDAVGWISEHGPAGWHWIRLTNRDNTARRSTDQDSGSPLALYFTSGTHSLTAKACIHTHQSLLGNALTVVSDAGMTADDVFISASPFTHLFGVLSCHAAWVAGASQAVMDRFDPAGFLQLAHKAQATVAFLVPTHVRDIVRYLKDHPDRPRPRLREVRVAGAALPADLVGEVQERLGARVVNHWGMSELGAGTYTHWHDEPAVPASSIGHPATGAWVRVVDAEGRPITGAGETGELWFTGPSLFYGYYGSPQLTEAALVREGETVWLKTGDQAAWRTDGRLQYRGRLKDIVNRGGMKISALEVENALMDFPGIRQAAIVPVADERLGERALLVVALGEERSLTLDDIRRHLEQKGVARYKWPEFLEVREALPTTPTGKISKARLREGLAVRVQD